MEKNNSVKEIEEKIIEVGLRIARRGEGALIVFGKANFKPLVEQKVPPFKIVDNLKLLESLALIDGAVIVNHEGCYGKLWSYDSIKKNNERFWNSS